MKRAHQSVGLAIGAVLLAACAGPLPAAEPPTPTARPPGPAAVVPPPPSPTTQPPAPTTRPDCSPASAAWLSAALATGELAYAYRADGEQRFPGMKRDIQFAFEGARQDALRWWRRIAIGAGFHDEAVGDGTTTWLRWPLERRWELDTNDEAQLSDPLDVMLTAADWQAVGDGDGCVLEASRSLGDATVEYRLELDADGTPVAAREVGTRPDAPEGEGVPAEWRIDYEMSSELPELPSMPPAPLPADDATALALLAVNDAPGSQILWRADAGGTEVVAYAGPSAYGFVAWADDGTLIDAAVLDYRDPAADLLQLGEGEYAVAIVLDERVSSLRLSDASGSRTIDIGVPGGLVEVVGYPDAWRFYFSDGSRVPRPR
jgi:hypothetical protein